jgi:hypothetical protein
MSKIWMAMLNVLISLPWSLVVAQAQGTAASVSGVIEGTVLNEKGKPVVDALVNVDNGMPTIGAIRYFTTDKKGHFVIDHLAWGNYKVIAQKESEDYPDMYWAFYSNNVFQSASISQTSPKAVVTIRIGPPCGVLHYSAVDASNGRTLDAGVTLRRASNPGLFLSGSNIYRQVFVPSLTDVLVEISAKGYEPWPPEAEKATLGKINLKPHEIYNLNVKLQPLKPSSAQSH